MDWRWCAAGAAAVLFVLYGLTEPARGHGAAEWIQHHPDFSWCCSKEDCNPSPEGSVHWTPQGYSVDGLFGTLDEGQKGFYRSPEVDRPWHCAIPGTQRLRCLFLPEGQG